MEISIRRAARTLSLAAALLALAGCQTAGKPAPPAAPLAALEAAPGLRRPGPGPYQATIEFDEKGCPLRLQVAAADRCDGVPAEAQPKCLLVRRGGQVDFVAVGSLAPAEVEFSLDFVGASPFDQDHKAVRLRKGDKRQARIKGEAATTTYTYQVTRPDCPARDPQIIVRD